jgi:hypothetical protein
MDERQREIMLINILDTVKRIEKEVKEIKAKMR